MKDFDFKAALAELEKIAGQAEDPATSLDDIDKYLSRSKELISACREYLRKAREKAGQLDA